MVLAEGRRWFAAQLALLTGADLLDEEASDGPAGRVGMPHADHVRAVSGVVHAASLGTHRSSGVPRAVIVAAAIGQDSRRDQVSDPSATWMRAG